MTTNLNYQVGGQGTPVIFVHGFSLDSRMWQPQFEHFTKTHQVITYDMRGFGKSPLPESPYSHVEDLHNLINELKIQKVHLVGLSLGGEVAIDYTLTYPETILSLTLADTSLGGYSSTVNWRVYAKEQGIEQAKQNWLNHSVFSSVKDKSVVFESLKKLVTDYSGWHWLNDDPRTKLNPSAIDRLGEIRVPTQIILGELDLAYYHDIAKILVERIPSAQLHKIANSGHMVNFEQSVVFNDLLDNFISTCERIK
ncbi:MAG: hypothetical protein DPW11_04045 [bacterium]|nr:alpha/beta hydrolase [Candidatus Microgenomates bacterium CPR3]MCQ3944919.1 hypothetical protein [bacterium]RIK50906.1 MAG: hypothetical protein DCC61_04195 [Candidatus Microgenomates bacterium]